MKHCALIVFSKLAFVFALSIGYTAHGAEDNSESIRLGMSTALSGPSQYLGLSIHKGMSEFFDEVNSNEGYQGEVGILGKPIELIAIDDFYDPETAVRNTKELIEQQHVLAMVGNVGTPTFDQLWQNHYLDNATTEEDKVAIFGAFTGASQLRESNKLNYVFNYRASYDQEMEVIVSHIVSELNISPNRIAFLLQGEQIEGDLQYQPDAYGAAGFSAAEKALRVAPYFFESSNNLTQAVYIRNQLETTDAIEKILTLRRNQESPEAIIIVGSYQASAHFIKFMHRLLPTTNFYNLSFAGAGELASALYAENINDRVYMTQVVPVSQRDLTHSLPFDLVEREGYLAAEEFVKAIRTCHLSGDENTITSLSIRNALRAYFEFGDSCLEQEPVLVNRNSQSQLSEHVELTQLLNGNWVHSSQSINE